MRCCRSIGGLKLTQAGHAASQSALDMHWSWTSMSGRSALQSWQRFWHLHNPDKPQHLFAYMRTIVRASYTIESTAWVAYDVAYRRQAVNQRMLDWGVLNSGLYNNAFTGRAKAIPRCSYCLADTTTLETARMPQGANMMTQVYPGR